MCHLFSAGSITDAQRQQQREAQRQAEREMFSGDRSPKCTQWLFLWSKNIGDICKEDFVFLF